MNDNTSFLAYLSGKCPMSDRYHKAMTYNILVSRPLKCHLPMRVGSYYLLCYYILFCTKPTDLTARVWPFSIDFNDNNFGCVPKNACGRGQETIILQVMA